MTTINRINFLMEAASLLPAAGHANQLLKSHLLTTCRELATDVTLPKKEFGQTRMCQRCSAIWLDGNLKLEMKSKKVKRPKQKKIVAKLKAGELMTRSQKSRAKWLQKNSKSRVEITCLLCKNKTKLHLDKTKPKAEVLSTIAEQQVLPVKKSTKKKQRKDEFAGLNPILIQASTSTSGCSAVTSTTTTSTTSSSSSATSSLPVGTQNLTKSVPDKKSKILPGSKTLKKAKNKLKTIPVPAPKEVSKTKQKNTLLQLAHLLKAANSSSTSNKKPNRLENLLR